MFYFDKNNIITLNVIYIVVSLNYSPKEIKNIKHLLNQIISIKNEVKLIFMFLKEFIEHIKNKFDALS